MSDPNRSTAVMARRATLADGGDPNDYFPTPPWAARAGGELIAHLDPSSRERVCWEPACGAGHMAHGLGDYFGEVRCSDLVERGHGAVLDFLSPAAERSADWIVTNPPFSEGEAFVRTAWDRATFGVAMLLRLQFLEGIGRHAMFGDCPLTLVAPFAERVPMVKGRWDPEASSATAYAWFLFLKNDPHPPAPRVRWVPPGSRARLTRPSDFERFAPERLSLAGDLFDEFQP